MASARAAPANSYILTERREIRINSGDDRSARITRETADVGIGERNNRAVERLHLEIADGQRVKKRERHSR